MNNWVKVECPLCGEMAVAETHPNLKRTWVGLKDDDEIDWDGGDLSSFVKAIEAKLKEKNT